MKKGSAVLQKGWASIGIVLGGGISHSGKLAKNAKARIKKALHLLEEGYIEKVMLSGNGTNKSKTEAKAYRDFLLFHGISKKQIMLEEQSMDTIGNAVYTKKKLLKRKNKNLVLITSDYHLERALMIFNHVFGKKYTFIGIPSASFSLHKLHKQFHEWKKKEIDKLLLVNVKSGDHKKAEKHIKEFIPSYN